MEDKKNRRNYLLIIILLLVIGISIGFATVSTTLKITGQGTIEKSSWDVHFDNIEVTQGSQNASIPAALDSNKTSITYSVYLQSPGDYYEFTVDMKNDGTIPAKVSATPTIDGLTSQQKEYVDYTVTYIDNSPVLANDALSAGTAKKIKVRVEYKKDLEASKLPKEKENVELTFAVYFVQG